MDGTSDDTSYRALARRYRPSTLLREGRVYDPTAEHPYTLMLRPFHGGLIVTVETAAKIDSRYLRGVSDMDSDLPHKTAAEMFREIQAYDSRLDRAERKLENPGREAP